MPLLKSPGFQYEQSISYDSCDFPDTGTWDTRGAASMPSKPEKEPSRLHGEARRNRHGRQYSPGGLSAPPILISAWHRQPVTTIWMELFFIFPQALHPLPTVICDLQSLHEMWRPQGNMACLLVIGFSSLHLKLQPGKLKAMTIHPDLKKGGGDLATLNTPICPERRYFERNDGNPSAGSRPQSTSNISRWMMSLDAAPFGLPPPLSFFFSGEHGPGKDNDRWPAFCMRRTEVGCQEHGQLWPVT